jgi:hypothetical protein
MHPNTFLRTFWRTEIRPEIFVAMSFDDAYKTRFEIFYKLAIESITYGGQKLKANRVDLSKTGDSILTDIMDGIAHSTMVLADVSTVGNDSKTGIPYRNGNVMYEVGLALASRHSSEVLLVRDDKEKFLFDVSTIPHMHVDFANVAGAIKALQKELIARLNEIQHIHDARLAVAVATLTAQERGVLSDLSQYTMNQVFWFKKENFGVMAALPRLLDKQLIRPARVTSTGKTAFKWTRLGKALAMSLDAHIPGRLIETEEPARKAGEGDGSSEPHDG